MKVGGFPEPFLKGAVEEAKRWRRSHVDRILREDLSDIASIRLYPGLGNTCRVTARNSVGSAISLNLWPDIQVSPHTIGH